MADYLDEESPFGYLEKSHNKVRQALDALETVLSEELVIPGYGGSPDRVYSFDTEKAATHIKAIAAGVGEMDLRSRGERSNRFLSALGTDSSSSGVYSQESVSAAEKVLEVTRWDLSEAGYFDFDRSGDPNIRVYVTADVSMLLSRVRRDQDEHSRLQEHAREHAARVSALNRSSDRFSLVPSGVPLAEASVDASGGVAASSSQGSGESSRPLRRIRSFGKSAAGLLKGVRDPGDRWS